MEKESKMRKEREKGERESEAGSGVGNWEKKVHR